MRTNLYKFFALSFVFAIILSACGGSQEPVTIVVTATSEPVAAVAEPVEETGPTALILQDLNVRYGPSSSYDIIDYIAEGSSPAIVGKNSDGTWLQIVYSAGPGGLGWVSTPFTQPGDISGVPVVSAPVASSSNSGGSSSSGSGNSPTTAPPTSDNSGGGGSPTTAPPTSDGGGGGGGQTAPDDSNYNIELEFKNAVKAKCCPTLQNVISYPSGDSSDKINFELKGFDSVTNSAKTTIIITCAGEGAEYVKIKFSRNNNTVGCNSTFTTNWTNFNYKGSFEIYVDSGSDVYVTWIAIFNSSK